MDGPTDRQSPRHFVRGFWATSLGTLGSRALGLVRDIVTAALLGLGQGGVMDALVVALRLPNLSRRFCGEGALAASLLPVFTAEHERSERGAWQLLSLLLLVLGAVLTGVVLSGEAVCWLWWKFQGAGGSPLLGLTAVLLPYLVFICLAAQVAAALQGLQQFRWPAAAPILLNVCWLAAAWLIAPHWAGDRTAQAYVIAAAVLLSGALQLALLLAALLRAGFRFELDLAAAWPGTRSVLRSAVLIGLGLAVTQINTLVDTLLAVALAGPRGARLSLGSLGNVAYPLETGAAAAIYYGERFYQLPLGVLGLALATALYPALARHAARGDRLRLGADLTTGLRLVWFTALPAGVGLMLVAEPLMRLLFVRGAFTEVDAQRAAAMIACYASAAWAYSALPLVVRGYYATGDRRTPLRVGIVAVGVDLVLAVSLLWPLGERALAISTAGAAAVQVVLLTAFFARDVPLDWAALRRTLGKGLLATGSMAAAVLVGRQLGAPPDTRAAAAWQLAGTIAAGGSVYLLTAWLLSMEELRLLTNRAVGRVSPAGPPELTAEAATR